MAFELQFFGATERVTGSLYALRAGPHTLLLECGLVQGTRDEELRNREAFPVEVEMALDQRQDSLADRTEPDQDDRTFNACVYGPVGLLVFLRGHSAYLG